LTSSRHQEISIIGIAGIPEINSGDNLGKIISDAIKHQSLEISNTDILVVAQKIVSKAEGKSVRLDDVTPSKLAIQWGLAYGKDPRVVQAALNESIRIVRMDRGVLISETRHGFVCANAGVDTSNVADGYVTLLPDDPDGSAQRLRQFLRTRLGGEVAVIISDTFGRPWREGLVNVAIGVAGLEPLLDLRGEPDWKGQPLRVTVMAVADELASAAELVMSKAAGLPVALISGYGYQRAESSARSLIRKPETDLFR
jgi:coenzyme F420-0:L-glutamate ligase/coenzyme F420-1:gamma-L-glutamate ligase